MLISTAKIRPTIMTTEAVSKDASDSVESSSIFLRPIFTTASAAAITSAADLMRIALSFLVSSMTNASSLSAAWYALLCDSMVRKISMVLGLRVCAMRSCTDLYKSGKRLMAFNIISASLRTKALCPPTLASATICIITSAAMILSMRSITLSL